MSTQLNFVSDQGESLFSLDMSDAEIEMLEAFARSKWMTLEQAIIHCIWSGIMVMDGTSGPTPVELDVIEKQRMFLDGLDGVR